MNNYLDYMWFGHNNSHGLHYFKPKRSTVVKNKVLRKRNRQQKRRLKTFYESDEVVRK